MFVILSDSLLYVKSLVPLPRDVAGRVLAFAELVTHDHFIAA